MAETPRDLFFSRLTTRAVGVGVVEKGWQWVLERCLGRVKCNVWRAGARKQGGVNAESRKIEGESFSMARLAMDEGLEGLFTVGGRGRKSIGKIKSQKMPIFFEVRTEACVKSS